MSDTWEKGGFSDWYYNYLARNTGEQEESQGVDPVTDNKETVKKPDSEDDIDEDMFEIPKAPWYEFRWLDRLV